jgi:hypothetical protein
VGAALIVAGVLASEIKFRRKKSVNTRLNEA